MPTDIARYSIELFKLGGEGAGIEEDRDYLGPDAALEITITPR
jgi:hypothetical protein